MKKKVTGLVLQGGGALGAYEYGVVKALYEVGGLKPDIIAGVSIGAISAAVLKGGKDSSPIKTLGRLWDKLTLVESPLILPNVNQSLSSFGNPGMYVPNPGLLTAPFTCTSLYDTTPLYQTLDELIDYDKLNDKGQRLIMTAVNVHTGEQVTFDNHERELISKHIVASGSLPFSFPMTEIDGKYYWDGGIFSNTPLAPLVNRLEEIEPDNPEIDREVIVVELFPHAGAMPNNLYDVFNRSLQIVFESKVGYDMGLFDKYGSYIDLCGKIDNLLKDNKEIQGNETFIKMKSHQRIRLRSIRFSQPELQLNAADFTPSTIQKRIKIGEEDGKRFIKA